MVSGGKNKMKMDFSQQYFIDLCVKVAKNVETSD